MTLLVSHTPSCDSCNLGKLFSFRRIGTVTVLAFLACSVTPVLSQTGLDGVRVGQASHPGPTHPTPEGAPTTLNVSEVLTHVSGSASSFPAADPGDPVPGSSPTQAPSSLCCSASASSRSPFSPEPLLYSSSPPLPRDSSRRLSGSPAPRRCRSRSHLCALLRLSLLILLSILAAPGFFCPVTSCPDHAHSSHGWLSFQSMRPHIEAHLSGQLLGDISTEWLRGQGFGTCEVCHRILSLRYNGRCSSCFHTLVSVRDRTSSVSRPLAEGAPSIWDVFVSGTRVRSSVPDSARDAWSRCFIIALADVVAHRDIRAWTDLLTLPALVLVAPSRGWASPRYAH